MNTQFDNDFAAIKTLNWTPWLGDNYNKTNLVLLGDSHYDDNDGWLEFKNATREFVTNQGLHSDNPNYSNRKFFQQIEKLLLNQSSSSFDERTKIWSSVSYLNLVQRLLSARSERPNDNDFDTGWKTFLEVAKIIKPTVCIKLGVDGVGRLGYLLNTTEKEWQRDNVQEFYNKPYVINLTHQEHKMKIIFINHPTGSFGFDIDNWTNHIHKQIPNLQEMFKV